MSIKRVKNTKKILAFSFLGIFMLMFAMQFVSAVEPAGFDKTITEPTWLVAIINFFGFGETWSTVIVSLAVLLMIFAATFDVLSFTAFETPWVKYLIAIGISLVAAVSRGVTVIVVALMGVAAGSVGIATTLAIIVAAAFFFVGSFFKSRMKAHGYRQTAREARDAFKIGRETSTAHIEEGTAAAVAAAKMKEHGGLGGF